MAGSSAQSSQQVLEAMNYYFGLEHCRSVQLVDDVAGSLNAEYFDLNGIDENYAEIQYYVWLDNGSSVDPAIAGKTGIQVIYTDGDSASVIAGLMQVAIDALDNFNASVSGDLVTITNVFLGLISVEDNSNAPALTFAILAQSFGGNLGAAAQGGATMTTEESVTDIVSDQTGDIVLDQISKGVNVTIEVTLAEMTDQRWEDLIGNIAGDIYNPGVDDIVGYGTSKLYQSKFGFAGKLVMHPIRLDNSDRSADISIHKTAAIMNSINYSGQDVQGAEFSFSAYRDLSKPEEVNLMSRGDYTVL